MNADDISQSRNGRGEEILSSAGLDEIFGHGQRQSLILRIESEDASRTTIRPNMHSNNRIFAYTSLLEVGVVRPD